MASASCTDHHETVPLALKNGPILKEKNYPDPHFFELITVWLA